MRVLVVKTSSLGDVVHGLSGVSDAAAALGDGASFDWVVEEPFAAVPARHPAVDRVIPMAWRRWRHDVAASRGALRDFTARLRQRRYDVVVDAQGLMKSAAVTALARGAVKAGLSRSSAREGAASLFYRRHVAVPREWHAVDRIRALFAGALGYHRPAGPPDYGIAPAAPGRRDGPPRCLLLHGTTWESKHWPETFWRLLAGRATTAGYDVLLPWGSDREHRRAQRIAAGTGARVLHRMSLDDLIKELAGASLAVGVDSGLAHLSGALEVPTVVIYGSTSSALTGVRGRRVRNLQAAFPCSPCLSRVCMYRGPAQAWQGEVVEPACYAALPPDTVWQAAMALEERHGHADRVLHL